MNRVNKFPLPMKPLTNIVVKLIMIISLIYCYWWNNINYKKRILKLMLKIWMKNYKKSKWIRLNKVKNKKMMIRVRKKM